MPLGFLNNLVTLINCESLKEMGGMECVTPSRSSCGHTLKEHFVTKRQHCFIVSL